jgi:hypothetical protein
MSPPRKPFADRLLAAAPPSADARGRYEKEVRAMLDLTLSPRQRGAYLLGGVFLLALGGFFAAVLAAAGGDRNEVIPYVMAYGGLTAVACLLAAVPMLRGFWGGTVRRARAAGWAAGIGVAYVGLVGWGLMAMARVVPDPLRDDTRIFGLVLVIYAAVAWVRHRVAQAELRTAEKLLEIELRLAELAEAKDGRPTPP